MIAFRIASLAAVLLSLQPMLVLLDFHRADAAQTTTGKTLADLEIELTSESNNIDSIDLGSKQSILISQANKSYYQSSYATSVRQALDVTPIEWAYEPFRSAVERYRVVRLYSDGKFKGSQPVTRFEAIDSLGAALTRIYAITDNVKGCGFPPKPKKKFTIPKSIKQNSFYFPAYKILAEASGNMVYLEGGESRTDGNQPLTRGDLAVILNRYFFTPIGDYVFPNQAIYEREPFASPLASKVLVAQVTSVSQFSDVTPNSWYYNDIRVLVERWGSVAGYPDGTWRPNKLLTRFEFIGHLNASLDRVSEVIAARTADCAQSNSKPEPSNDNSPISGLIRFTFTNPGAYSRCVEDILQLYQDRRKFQQNGRTSDCLPEVFQVYTERGLSGSQALELIQAADTYATTSFTSRLYPPKGQRVRILQYFGFSYAVDASK